MIIEQIILASDFLNGIIERGEIIPVFGILVGIIVPLGAFFFVYHEQKNKNETIIEIPKNLDDPSQVEELIKIFDTRKKEPIDYRRSGVITLFVGSGLYMLGFIAFGRYFRRSWCISSLNWNRPDICWISIPKYR